MDSKERMIKLSLAMYMMDNIKVRDILTLLIPHIKYVLGKYINYNSNRVINIEKLSVEINSILGYQRFPRTVVLELLNRLKIEKFVNYDKKVGWKLIKDLTEFVQEYEKNVKENDIEFDNLINNFKEYLINNCLKKDLIHLSNEKIYDRVYEYLIVNGLIISNHLEIVNTIKEGTDSFDYFFTEFILDSNINNPDVINTITRMVEGAYLANAIYNCEDNYGIKKMHNLECYIDTSIMLYLLKLKEPSICDSYLEILDLYNSVGIKCKCLKSIVNEIRYIVSHYSNNEFHYGNRKLSYFENSSSFEGKKSKFLSELEFNIKKLKIDIVGGEETFKHYCNKNRDVFDNLKKDIESKIYYGKDTALNTDVESIMYVLDRRGDYEANYIKDARSYFITSNLNLVKAANLSLKIEYYRSHLSPIISINYFTNLIWAFDMKINSSVTKKRILSIAQQSNIIKDNFISKIETIINDNEKGNVGDYTYEQIMQDAIILSNIRKKVGNNEKSVNVDIIKEAIFDKEKQLIDKGKNEGVNAIIKKQYSKFEQKYLSKCESINYTYMNERNSLNTKISKYSTFILFVVFIILLVLFIVFKIKSQISFLNLCSIIILIFDIFFAILAFCSLFFTIQKKSFFIHNLLYHCLVKSIDRKQNDELLIAKNEFDNNVKMLNS